MQFSLRMVGQSPELNDVEQKETLTELGQFEPVTGLEVASNQSPLVGLLATLRSSKK